MIKVCRYNTISVLPDVMKLQEDSIETCEPVGAYCVDTSHFVPRCEAVAVPTLSAGDMANQGAYDFKDGRDSGAPMPRVRSHSYTGDIAELSVINRVADSEAQDNIKKSTIDYVNDMKSKQAQAQVQAQTSVSAPNRA